jgi:anaerobic magnesium-protoporphyrin IX monomethyl ester cyclase
MNVLFVHSEQDPFSPNRPLETLERMHFGISYISSVLKEAGHRTRLVVISRETAHKVDDHIRALKPGLICFTAVYAEYHTIARAATRIKERFPDIFLLLGGSHATLKPDDCLEDPFDAVCVGEGEYPTLELAEQLEAGEDPSGISNLCIRKPDGSVERNAPRPFLEDLDSLPFPDRDIWMPWVSNPYSRPSVLLGRGCPFVCTYCSNHALRKVADGKYVRLRNPRNVVEELSAMKEKNPLFGEVYLEVETLGVNKEWVLELCAELNNFNASLDSPIVFGTNLRVTPNADYDELFTALAKSNFRFVNIGLESGSERIRREVLKRLYSNDDIIRTVETARKHGLQVGFYNLIGLPGETRADFRKTVELNRICQPDWFLIAVFFPYPGTELHDTCKEMGLLENGLNPYLERRRPVLDLPGFSKRQVGRRRDWFPYLVYHGHRPLKECLWLVGMAKIYSHRRLIEMHKRFIRGYHFKKADKEMKELIDLFYTFEEDESYLEEPDTACL